MNSLALIHNFRQMPKINIKKTPFLRYNEPKPCRPKRTALVFLSPEFEAIEFVTSVTVLRRGGVDVKIVSTADKECQKSTKDIYIKPEMDLQEVCGSFDALIMQGCVEAAEQMGKCKRIGEMLKEQECNCKIIAAICEAPLVLAAHDIGKGRNLTAYPTVSKQLQECGYCYKEDGVVVHDFLITGKGPAFSMVFALTVLMHLTDECNASNVAKDLLVK